MFLSQLEIILTALGNIPDLKTVDVWQGEIKDLLEQVQKLPSAWTLFSAAEFESSTIIGSTEMPSDFTWSVIVITENRKDRSTAARETLALLEKMIKPATDPEPGLTRLPITGGNYLWPTEVKLLGSENGKTAYGVKFAVETNK